MKVTFLGTAAAEGIPALWCECEICQKAFQLKGKDIRRRCSYLIDSDTLVDYGPDIFFQSISFNIHLDQIKRVIFTHSHFDHLSYNEFAWRRPHFSVVSHPIKIYGSSNIFEKIQSYRPDAQDLFSVLQLELVETQHGQIHTDGDFELLSLTANHAVPSMKPQVQVIGKGNKHFFIANDTGNLPDESWEILKGRKLDLVEIDSTMGLRNPDQNRGHMGVNAVIAFRDRLLELGCITQDTPVYANHFSHNGGGNHADYEKFYQPHGIQVAYDGLIVNV